jgi:hypothetical protein
MATRFLTYAPGGNPALGVRRLDTSDMNYYGMIPAAFILGVGPWVNSNI